MPLILLGKIDSMFEVACLPANSNGCLQIKWEVVGIILILPRFSRICGLDEVIQTRNIPQLGVCVEKEGSVIGIGETSCMELLQICGEVMNLLGVKELIFARDDQRAECPEGYLQ